MKAMAISGLTAFLAYAINRWIVDRYGEWAIKLLVPAVEEGLKTGLSIAFGGSLIATHILFGIYEAGYDLVANPGVKVRNRWFAALAALTGHGIFGAITWLLLARGLDPLLSVGIVGLVHGLWNAFVLR